MKKLVFLTCLMLVATSIRAELTHQAIAVTPGFTEQITRLNSPSELEEDKTKLTSTSRDGFKVGLLYDATFYKGLGFTAEINYNYAVNNSNWEDYMYDISGHTVAIPTIETKARTESHILELNVAFQYKAPIAMDTWLIFYTGPAFQGILKFNATEYFRYKLTQQDAPMISYRYTQKELAEHFTPVNLSWGLGAGFQYKRIFIRGGYNFGLTNPRSAYNFGEMDYKDPKAPAQPDSRLTRGRSDEWHLNIGFYFWQKD